jgi:hypothetical protein
MLCMCNKLFPCLRFEFLRADDPVLPAVGALILSEDDGAMDPVLPP